MDSVVENLSTNAGDMGLILGLRRSPGEEKGIPFCPTDRKAWWTIVHGVTKESEGTD